MGRSPLPFSACMSAMLSLAQASMESQGGMERCIASICLPIQTGGGARRNRYKFGFAYWIQIWICILLDGDKGPRLVRHITNIGMGEGRRMRQTLEGGAYGWTRSHLKGAQRQGCPKHLLSLRAS